MEGGRGGLEIDDVNSGVTIEILYFFAHLHPSVLDLNAFQRGNLLGICYSQEANPALRLIYIGRKFPAR